MHKHSKARSISGLLTCCLALSTANAIADGRDGRFDIYWVDVEGGAATLMVTPTGESVLIDTGNPGPRDPDRITRVATQEAGIRRIDHLIITHYHRDHFGGAAELSKLLPIGTVYDNGEFDNMPDDPGPAYWGFKCEQRKVINPGDQLPLKTSERAEHHVSIRCLGTRKSFVEAEDGTGNQQTCAQHRPKDRDGSDNANSVVSIIEFGPFRFLDAGDLTWNQEYRLVCPDNLVGEVDVYQVTHHGLDSSSNPVVLNSVRPVVAVMNNGARKGTLPEVFANLKRTASIQSIYQLHRNEREDGSVNNTAKELIANQNEQGCRGHHIKLSVHPMGTEYTVSIPAHGHEQTYQTKPK